MIQWHVSAGLKTSRDVDLIPALRGAAVGLRESAKAEMLRAAGPVLREAASVVRRGRSPLWPIPTPLAADQQALSVRAERSPKSGPSLRRPGPSPRARDERRRAAEPHERNPGHVTPFAASRVRRSQVDVGNPWPRAHSNVASGRLESGHRTAERSSESPSGEPGKSEPHGPKHEPVRLRAKPRLRPYAHDDVSETAYADKGNPNGRNDWTRAWPTTETGCCTCPRS